MFSLRFFLDKQDAERIAEAKTSANRLDLNLSAIDMSVAATHRLARGATGKVRFPQHIVMYQKDHAYGAWIVSGN